MAPATGAAPAAPVLRLAIDSPSSVIVLGPAAHSALQAMKDANAHGVEKRLQIGIRRDVDVPGRSSDSLPWIAVDGGYAAHWKLLSKDARAIRLGMAIGHLPPGSEIRFADDHGHVYGPVTPDDAGSSPDLYWGPVLEGEAAIAEIFVRADAATEEVAVSIPQISHLFVTPWDPKIDSQVGASGFCEVNLLCRSATDAALAFTGRAIARMSFVDGGLSYLCTGTLLNPIGGSFTPYFYSANHCISTQLVASTLTTFWFFDSTACGVNIQNPGAVQVPGGATLLYANSTSDALFLRLNSAPPANAVFAGWDAATLAIGTPLTAIHHPAGDLKKVSLGSMSMFQGYFVPSLANYLRVQWNSVATGVTEGGSSGSGIFAAVGAPATDYRLRGGLTGGPSACTQTISSLYDYYSRFDQVYPSIAQYLNPPIVDPPRLGNLSTRMQVLTGGNVMIAGFIIGGTANKTVAITATGPSLAPFGITNYLADPTLQLVRQSDGVTIAANDDWQTDVNHALLQSHGFAPGNPLEPGLYVSLPPGAYTAIVSGVGGTKGVSVVGVFEVDHPEIPLVNISTRGFVQTGGNVMIGGFIISGSASQKVAITATGPSLAPFGIANFLPDPMLQIVRSSDGVTIATNDDWQTDPSAALLQASGFAPANPLEPGLLLTLPPGAYTAVVSGLGGVTGVSVVGVFVAP